MKKQAYGVTIFNIHMLQRNLCWVVFSYTLYNTHLYLTSQMRM